MAIGLPPLLATSLDCVGDASTQPPRAQRTAHLLGRWAAGAGLATVDCMTRFGYTLMTEQSGPRELVRYAVAAERAGFDFEVSSDHYSPWLDRAGPRAATPGRRSAPSPRRPSGWA